MSEGPKRKPPASRSRIDPNTLGESMRGRQSHSTFPLGAINAVVSQSDRNPYSPMGGKGEAMDAASAVERPLVVGCPLVDMVALPRGGDSLTRPLAAAKPRWSRSDVGLERVAGRRGSLLQTDRE